jgi:hypothetical protein
MDPFKKLETERLLIRQFNKIDEEGFINFMTNALITDNLAFGHTVKSKEGALSIINETI